MQEITSYTLLSKALAEYQAKHRDPDQPNIEQLLEAVLEAFPERHSTLSSILMAISLENVSDAEFAAALFFNSLKKPFVEAPEIPEGFEDTLAEFLQTYFAFVAFVQESSEYEFGDEPDEAIIQLVSRANTNLTGIFDTSRIESEDDPEDSHDEDAAYQEVFSFLVYNDGNHGDLHAYFRDGQSITGISDPDLRAVIQVIQEQVPNEEVLSFLELIFSEFKLYDQAREIIFDKLIDYAQPATERTYPNLDYYDKSDAVRATIAGALRHISQHLVGDTQTSTETLVDFSKNVDENTVHDVQAEIKRRSTLTIEPEIIRLQLTWLLGLIWTSISSPELGTALTEESRDRAIRQALKDVSLNPDGVAYDIIMSAYDGDIA